MSAKQELQTRQCAFCGKRISVHVAQCPFCREMVPQVRLSSRVATVDGNKKIRRGLLYMLLAGVVYYFTSASILPLQLPVSVTPVVNNYLAPLLFLGGLGMSLYGLILKAKS